jgi:hypothetical protein
MSYMRSAGSMPACALRARWAGVAWHPDGSDAWACAWPTWTVQGGLFGRACGCTGAGRAGRCRACGTALVGVRCVVAGCRKVIIRGGAQGDYKTRCGVLGWFRVAGFGVLGWLQRAGPSGVYAEGGGGTQDAGRSGITKVRGVGVVSAVATRRQDVVRSSGFESGRVVQPTGEQMGWGGEGWGVVGGGGGCRTPLPLV